MRNYFLAAHPHGRLNDYDYDDDGGGDDDDDDDDDDDLRLLLPLLLLLRLLLRFLTWQPGFISELPTLIFIARILLSCWRVPIIINSVLSSLKRSLSCISHGLIFSIQHSFTRTASSWDVLLIGLKLREICVSPA